MPIFIDAASALRQAMAEINLEGEISVVIPDEEWSRFSFYRDGKVRDEGPFKQIKIHGIIFRSDKAN